ncbi:MAG: RluA family pseudouridine synthase [Chloroflexi bacterium]|nr:MAG: RluA family pseudouridine synthase [Chloroflexota bacterium]
MRAAPHLEWPPDGGRQRAQGERRRGSGRDPPTRGSTCRAAGDGGRRRHRCRGRLRGRRRPGRRQAGGSRRPPVARPSGRHAGQRAPRPCGGERVRRYRRGAATGIVHRLDRDTSGLLMVAKHDAAQASLMAQLKARRVKKTYIALVAGEVAASVGRIEAPIGRDPRHRTRMAVTADGRPAVTGYRVRERFPGWTLLELDLVTGRTHQIRVHLDAIGHPVAGDPVYGSGTSRRGPNGLRRLFLHAWRLEFAAPSDGHLIRATAPLPDELEDVLDSLRSAAPRSMSGA